MKQFSAIFSFEYRGIVKSKTFIVVTVLLAVLVAIALSLPTIIGWFSSDDEPVDPDTEITAHILLADGSEDGSLGEALPAYAAALSAALPGYEFDTTDLSGDELTDAIDGETADGAVIFSSMLDARYVVRSSNMYDSVSGVLSEVMRQTYLSFAMAEHGFTPEEAAEVLSAVPTVETVETEKSFMSAYACTYVMIMFLYMAVLLYGNMVLTSVATEKSSRAMELLITTVNPSSLMFGKVLGVGLAALTQLIILIAVGLGAYGINRSSYDAIPIIDEILSGITPEVIIYLIVFFILGFFLYAFMFGALGSTISRLEESNTASTPIVFLILIAFFISMTAMTSGNTDSLLVVISSFIPFFSPMVMYVRICMGFVPLWQIVVSVALMVGANVFIGWLAARIYRIGVLLYGKAPKLGEVFRMLRRSKQ
ncbi:MAG: ABC transporter permease [Clostridia bacterium]|nr:ABC transporter permease [Clostridia bacterium]